MDGTAIGVPCRSRGGRRDLRCAGWRRPMSRLKQGRRLRQQLAQSPNPSLQEQLKQREEEILELRQVIAMKDGIIRSLGEKLGAAEVAGQVISMKDQVIRQLQAELEDIRVALEQGPRDGDLRPFTALPIAPASVYIPSPGSSVDERIADFSNRRRNLVLFTRLEEEVADLYLYGRMLVQCFEDDEEGILVQDLASDEMFSISEFVWHFEAREHAELERHFLAALTARPAATAGFEPATI
ncbi:unnamed protein product [Effrenium voratum]|nr:unnamed protein product [Effrenium voratum]